MENIRRVVLKSGHVIDYNDDKHTYKADGTRVKNVTTVLGVMDKPGLPGWAAKTAVKCLLDCIEPGTKYSRSQLNKYGEHAAGGYREASAQGMNVGTITHRLIEHDLQGIIDPEGVKAPLPRGVTLKESKNRKVAERMGMYRFWRDNCGIEWQHAEKIVYSEKYGFAGTLDARGLKSDCTIYTDFKTNDSGIYPEAFIQVFGYMLADRESDQIEDGDFALEVVNITEKGVLPLRATPEIVEICARLWLNCLGIYEDLKEVRKFIRRQTK